MKLAARAAVCAAALFTCSALPSNAAALPPSAFAYDTAAPLDVHVNSTRTAYGVRVSDVTFASAGGRHVHGELTAPAGSGSHAAVLFVHWLGDPETTNLTEFRSDAAQLAKRGIVSLAVDTMWAQPDWFEKGRTIATDYQRSIDQVIDLRRALDVLLAQPGVDASRLAYVGHDFGAMYGAVLSGIDSRPQYYVLMAGTATFAEWYLLGAHPADTSAYEAQMAALDPPQYLRQSKARAYLFQYANKDRYIKPDRAYPVFEAAPAPKAMAVYVAGHSLNVPQARAERNAWLIAHLVPKS